MTRLRSSAACRSPHSRNPIQKCMPRSSPVSTLSHLPRCQQPSLVSFPPLSGFFPSASACSVTLFSSACSTLTHSVNPSSSPLCPPLSFHQSLSPCIFLYLSLFVPAPLYYSPSLSRLDIPSLSMSVLVDVPIFSSFYPCPCASTVV